MASSCDIGSARIGMMSPCVRIFCGCPSAILQSYAHWRTTIWRNSSRSAIACRLHFQMLPHDMFLVGARIGVFCADQTAFVEVNQCVVHQAHPLFFSGLNNSG